MTNRRGRLIAVPAAAVLVALCWPIAAGAAVRPLSLPEQVARAERIVVSEVVEVRNEVRKTRDGELPFTVVTLRTLRTLKGAPSVQLMIEMAGGRALDASGARTLPSYAGRRIPQLEVLGMPSFQAGDRDVLFLSAAGSLSPLVGFQDGRFRIMAEPAGSGQAVVATDDGKPLRSENGDVVSLGAFERMITRLVAGGQSVGSGQTVDSGQWTVAGGSRVQTSAALWPAPVAVTVRLGPSPALLNACTDWPCVVARVLEPFGALAGNREAAATTTLGTARRDPGSRAGADDSEDTDVHLEVEWATEIFGRTLDDLTLAVTTRRTVEGRRTVTVFLNRTLAWSAYEGDARVDGTGRPLIDLARVLAAEFQQVFEPPAGFAEPTVGPLPRSAPRGETDRARAALRSRLTEPEAAGVQVRALAPCDPDSGHLINPRMLTFQSADDWAMSAYQVGIFREGASAPERTVELGRDAFLIRRVVDLPASVAAAMQQSFVTMIQASGLSTTSGVVYSYRVRGIWAGGTTAWSEASQTLVFCPGL